MRMPSVCVYGNEGGGSMTDTLRDEDRLEQKRAADRRWCEANREAKRVYDRQQREANPEKFREKNRRYREAHPDAVREGHLRSRAANPRTQAIREQSKRWSDAHPEKVSEYSRRWRETNREAAMEVRRRYEARKAGVPHLPWTTRGILDRDEWMCLLVACLCPSGREIDPSVAHRTRWAGTADHIIPISKGGADTPDNLQAAHLACNSSKGNR
jgi:5-methylcytosine-specific restriction endonuclease McrA